MRRRSFLAGLALAPLAASLPAEKAVRPISGTITGRWTSSQPAWQELTRREVKALTFHRAYGGMGIPEHINCRCIVEADLSEIEARVMANMEAGKDPYVL